MTTPAGLFNKYLITRTDGQPLHPEFEGFVLRLDEHGDPAHVAACRDAVLAYAMAIQPHMPDLASDIAKRWGPPQPEGWEHHYFKPKAGATGFLISKAVETLCNGLGILFLTGSEWEASIVENRIHMALEEKRGSADLGLIMHQWVNVVPINGPLARLQRSLNPRTMDRVGCILVDQPFNTTHARAEGDPRIGINRFLARHPQPQSIRRISVETLQRWIGQVHQQW